MAREIRRVAVLGAGTMGAGIAALAANAGLAVELLDIAQEDAEGAARDAVVRAGFERMRQARPPALADEAAAARIRLGNFADDFERVGGADWIVEAIVEQLGPKRALMERVEAAADAGAIISSNTSGIPLARIAEGRSAAFRRRFLGTHFFNPPRYLKLLELIPTADTAPEVVAAMRAFGEGTLDKGVVIARDTPNFAANRIGSYSGMLAVRRAFEQGLGIEEVDVLTGPLIGRPRTGTFRLADQVGLDVRVGVARNLYEAIPDDPFRAMLVPPEPLVRMVEAGRLGNKSGGGFYRRAERDGQTVFDVLDLETLAYRPARQPDLTIVAEAERQGDLGARLRFLLARADEDAGARYVRDVLLGMLEYAGWRAPEIAYSLADVDRAMQWGYGWEAGPFRTWDLLGVERTAAEMERLGLSVAPWVREMLAGGGETFYRRQDAREVVYDPATGTYG